MQSSAELHNKKNYLKRFTFFLTVENEVHIWDFCRLVYSRLLLLWSSLLWRQAAKLCCMLYSCIFVSAIQSPPFKKRKLEKVRKPLTFTVIEATAAKLHSQVLSTGQQCASQKESIIYWLENILLDLKVETHKLLCTLYSRMYT